MINVPSTDDINKKLEMQLHPAFEKEKAQLECIKIIAKRFAKCNIIILDHIKSITAIGYKYEQGFEFWPVDRENWLKTLRASKKFVPDKKDNLVGCAASAVTNGLGIRELGKDMSLHCAVSSFKCSVHLDNTGFRIMGPNGPMYSLDGGQHVIYDLLWDDLVVRNAYNLNYELGWALDKIRPIFLNSKNKYSQYGFGIDAYDSPSLKVKIDFTATYKIGKNLNKDFYKDLLKPKGLGVMFNVGGTHNFLSW